MKIARTFTLATAAFLSTGMAFAATGADTFVSGTGTLDFKSNDFFLQGLLRVRTTFVLPDGNPTLNTADFSSATKSATLTFDSATISGADGKVAFTAGQSQLSLYTLNTQVDENGDDRYDLPALINLIALRNITFDLSDASIRADVTSYTGTVGDVHLVAGFGRVAVFKGIAPISDGTQGLIVDGHASGSTVGGLHLTDESADIVLTGLYAWPDQPLDKNQPYGIYQVARASNWGTASASGTFTATVPEVSTLSLMLVGLLPVVALGRRSRQA